MLSRDFGFCLQACDFTDSVSWVSGVQRCLVAEFISLKSRHFQFYSGQGYPKKCKVYPLSY